VVCTEPDVLLLNDQRRITAAKDGCAACMLAPRVCFVVPHVCAYYLLRLLLGYTCQLRFVLLGVAQLHPKPDPSPQPKTPPHESVLVSLSQTH
jgi:hypothetical protein